MMFLSNFKIFIVLSYWGCLKHFADHKKKVVELYFQTTKDIHDMLRNEKINQVIWLWEQEAKSNLVKSFYVLNSGIQPVFKVFVKHFKKFLIKL